MAGQATAVAAGVVVMFAVAGRPALDALGVSLEALQVAGGVLLALLAFDLLRADCRTGDDAGSTDDGAAFVPLGTPLLAGPGAITATLLFLEQAYTAAAAAAVATGVAAALGVVYFALRYVGGIGRALHDTGLNLLPRLMGLLTAATAAQLIATGVAGWAEFGVH